MKMFIAVLAVLALTMVALPASAFDPGASPVPSLPDKCPTPSCYRIGGPDKTFYFKNATGLEPDSKEAQDGLEAYFAREAGQQLTGADAISAAAVAPAVSPGGGKGSHGHHCGKK